ncbi:HD domain-containing protein [Candidatus Dependentiae bacterium]|nr:HD domain-containing protein [Candidatus Dependentiae bacterium]
MKNLKNFFKSIEEIKPILQDIVKVGGVAYLVGGSVRDLVLGKTIKDIDIEVHKISLDKLQNCLKKFGPVRLVGKKFGVLRIDGLDIDWSLPRKDSKGRKPKVEIDPEMTINQALRRRDLTMNAMAIDLSEFIKNPNMEPKIIDPFGGLEDIQEKKLRAVDAQFFLQDPLRFFRVMQFLARFEMEPDKCLNELCKEMDLHDVYLNKPVSKERIFEEIKKLFLKSRRPSLGFRWLHKINRLRDIFPELYDLISVEQRKDYHPEGDVFEHTMQTLDAAAQFDEYQNQGEKFLLMLAALCHDLGKAITTDENLSCKGHEKAGVPITKKLLKRFVLDKDLIKSVCKLVKYHLRPGQLLQQESSIKAYKRLAKALAPEISLRQVAILNLCDVRGRNPKKHVPLKRVYQDRFEKFLNKIREINIEHGPEEPVLKGRHLLDVIQPGPEMGKLLKKAYEIQMDENIKDVEELKKRVLQDQD